MNTQITSAVFAASGQDASAAEFYLADCTEAAGFAEALQAAGGRFERLDGAPGDWRTAQAHPVLVIYERAETAVCKGLAGGQSPAQALEHWQARAQALLVFCRKNRRRLALVEAGSLRRDPDPVLERVCWQLGIKALPRLSWDPAAPAAGPVWQVIADQAVAGASEAAALNAELEARAVPAGGQPDALAAADQAAQACRQQLQDLAALRSAQGQQQAQRRETDGRLAALEAQAAAKQSQAELLQLQLRSLQEALEAERRQTARLAEADAALSEERRVKLLRGETIQKLRGQIAELEAQLGERDARLAEKDAQMQALRDSSSWRITAPMRRIKLALTRRRGP
ncbi:hypothetical protein [Leisingera sp. McT4-56]|uniref:hypothetical protein n=1 Tax=Leisingera sp. McT4-56 TaxID=2881255 RepID=UPI001CF7F9E3|nr:hypothetical protein [Leisingera sp. McT4-56]MCB4457210.1 hypothetical protein [Leisingera sp. McT4-56]